MIHDEGDLVGKGVKNTVKYELYTSAAPSEALVRRYKDYLRDTVMKNVDSSSREDFNLKVNTKRCMCNGSRRFNQNIEEEWFIIYCLYQLSRFDHDLVIRVRDSDGEILLIEAAEELPLWLESSKSKNRVFIHKGKLHIIPEHINLRDLHGNYQGSLTNTTTQVAAQFVRDANRDAQSGVDTCPAGAQAHSAQGGDAATTARPSSACLPSPKVKTLASPSIQAAIEEQLSGMPDRRAWLSKKFEQLDEIISEKIGPDQAATANDRLQKRFRDSLTLSSVMAMNEEDLQISPISSASPSPTPSTSSSATASSSSSWIDEQQLD